MLFQIHPDGYIKFGEGDLSYADTIENFLVDGDIVLPELQEGAGIIIDQFKSALLHDGCQTGAGEVWDSCAAEVIANIESYIASQTERREHI